MHFSPDAFSVMHRLRVLDKKFRSSFVRKNRVRFNALKDNKDIRVSATEYTRDVVENSPQDFQRSRSLAKNKAAQAVLSYANASTIFFIGVERL